MPPNAKIPDNSGIDQALKEFEAKSNASMPQAPVAPTKEVEGVKFETDSYKAVKFYNETDTPKIIRWVMKFSGGAIKEQRHAEYALFGFVVVAVAISLFLFFTAGSVETTPPIYQEDLTPTARQTIPKEVLDTIPYKNAK